MIVSASRRTDIPAFYFPWFLERLREGFVDVRNPFNANQVRRVPLGRESTELVVFWTKNPLPMENLLPEFEARGIPYLILFTLTPYGREIEPGLPDKEDLLRAFLRLAERLGPGRVSWRYDPIFLGGAFDEAYHLDRFADLAGRLSGSTERCIASFVSPYRTVKTNLERLGWRESLPEERHGLYSRLATLAAARGIGFQTCAEEALGGPDGFGDACLDAGLLKKIAGREDLELLRDPHQRRNCLCAKSVDIGTYGTCRAGCVYCYAGGAKPRKEGANSPF